MGKVDLEICYACKEFKDRSEYDRAHKQNRKHNGLHLYCKPCTKEKRREFYQKYKETLLAAQRKFAKTAKGRAIKLRYYENEKKNGKRHARAAVYRAVKRGIIKRTGVCRQCGDKKTTHFHHVNGYDRVNQLNVIEICMACHGVEHRTQG